MHRWVRRITVGAGGAALVAASFGAGLSPAGADPRHDDDADAAVWNDQFATVDIDNDGEATTGGNQATALSGNVVIIGQGASADAELLAASRDEILAWFYSEGFADWSGVGGLVDTGFSVIPGAPAVLPVLGGSATNLVESINNSAIGIAGIVSGDAAVTNSTGVGLTQAFSGNEGATADATGGDADATVGNDQTAHVDVSNDGYASSGGNQATTASGNAVVIGQGASAGAGASVDGNASNGGGGSVTGGSASNTVGSVTNSAQGQATIQTGDATVSNSSNVNVSQSNTGNGGATATATGDG